MGTRGQRERRRLGRIVLIGMLGPLAGGAQASLECKPTAPDMLGPFYVPDAPLTKHLAAPQEAGERLVISGRVVGGPDCVPLAGAVVEVWQASASGRYYFPGAEGGPEHAHYLLRGQILTDHEGHYSFETVLPAAYDLGDGHFRPPHIHFRVTHPNYLPLVTQLYFAGTPGAPADPFGKNSQVIALSREGEKENKAAPLRGEFNITLRPRTVPKP